MKPKKKTITFRADDETFKMWEKLKGKIDRSVKMRDAVKREYLRVNSK